MGYSFLQATNDTSDLTTYTFSSQNLGTAASDRHIIVCIQARKSGAATTLSSVTIGGVTATIVRQQSNSDSNSNIAAIAIANVPTGTTGDIVVTFGAGMVRCAIQVYRADSLTSATPHDHLASTAADPSVALDIPAGGFAIAGALSNSASSATWTNLTEDHDNTLESFVTVTSASDNFASTQTDLTITCDFASSGSTPVGIFASWGISGGTADNDERDAKVTGKDTANNTRSAKVKGGHTLSVDLIDISFSSGGTATNDTRSAKSTGKDTASDARSAKLTGQRDPITDLQDNFNDNSIDSAKWINFDGTETNNRFEFTGESDLTSQNKYTLIGLAASGLVNMDTPHANYSFRFRIHDQANSSNNNFFFWITNGSLKALKTDGGTETELTSTTHSNTNHKYLRIRESSGTIYYDYSSDGINWSNLTSTTVAWTPNDVQAYFYNLDESALSKVTYIDNFNITPVGDERDAKVAGKDTSNATRPAKTTGKDASNDVRSAKTTGIDTSSSNRPAKVAGKDSTSDSRSSKATGILDDNSSRSSKLTGIDTASSNRSAKVTGQDSANASRPAKLTGSDAANSSRSAKITGVVSGYSTPQYLYWTKINTGSNNVNTAIVYELDVTTPSDSSIDWHLSNDGGSTWEAVTAGSEHTFTTTGNDLRARVTLNASTDLQDTPSLNRVSFIWTNDFGTVTSDYRSAKITGKNETSDTRASKITGDGGAADNRTAKTTGKDTSVDTRSSKTTGSATANAVRPAKTTGKDTANSSRSAKVTGVSGYSTPQYLYWTKINTGSTNVDSAFVYELDVATPSDSSIDWHLSNDGGATWESATAGSEHTFTTTGNDFRARATLNASTDGQDTPSLNRVSFIWVNANGTVANDSRSAKVTGVSSDSITLTDVTDNTIIQRDASNQGSLTISGSYTGTPTAIQARVVQDGTSTEVKTWTTIDASPTGGTFSGLLTGIDEGGWYNIQVRFSNSTGVTDSGSNAFGVGILIGCIGQSNMEHFFDYGSDYTPNDLLRVYDSGSWVVPTANGAVTFGNEIIADQSVPVGLLDYAVGATGLNATADSGAGYWLDISESSLYDTFIDAVTALGGYLESVVWYQGESDAIYPSGEAQYESDLATLVSRLRADISPPSGTLNILLCQIGRYTTGNDDNWQGVRNAQRDYCLSDSNTYLAATCLDLPLQGDGIHLTSVGQTELGQRLAQTAKYIFGSETYYLGPSITNYHIVNETTIDVTLSHDGGTDFSPTSSITGFSVTDDAVDETISSVVRIDGSTIRITVSGTLSGDIVCKYQFGANPSVTSPVLDNTALTLPLQMSNGSDATYTYQSDRSSKIIGKDTSNDARSAKTTGQASDNNTRSAKLLGKDATNDTRSAKSTGKDAASSIRSGKITGTEEATVNSSRSGKVTGVDTDSDTRLAKITGQTSTNDTRGAKVLGIDTTSDTRSGKVTGKDTSSSNRGAKLTGIVSSSRSAKLTGAGAPITSRTTWDNTEALTNTWDGVEPLTNDWGSTDKGVQDWSSPEPEDIEYEGS